MSSRSMRFALLTAVLVVLGAACHSSDGSGADHAPDAASAVDGQVVDGSDEPARDAAVGMDAQTDGGVAVTAPCQVFVMPTNCSVPDGGVLPGELRCTG